MKIVTAVLLMLALALPAAAQDPVWRLLGANTSTPNAAVFYAPSTFLREGPAAGILTMHVRVEDDGRVSTGQFAFAVDCDTGVFIVSDYTGETDPEVAPPGSLADRLRTLLCGAPAATGLGTRA
jgi:hypothetical protein